MAAFDVLIRGTSEVVTCDGPLAARAEETLAPIRHGAVGIVGGEIAWLGESSRIPAASVTASTEVVDAAGGFVGPGLVDCHTHVVFAGDRSDEFEQRCQGRSYLEIAAAGGGILRTVTATRAASEDDLVRLALPRLERLLAQGVTTVEVKSGYGLDADSELKLLRAIGRLGTLQPANVVATFLGLHAVPSDQSRERWIEQVLELLPRIATHRLARFCDAFVEQSAFTHDEARRVMKRASELGLTPRLHVDQLTANGGAQLAAELGAATADHLEQISTEGIAALARSKTVAVLAPTSTLFAKVKPWAPGRALRDAGVTVALCTNCNPGSSMSENVSLAMGLACLENGLTPAEAYLGFTRAGGLALRDDRLGRLFVGGPADLVVSRAASYRELTYHLAMNDTQWVIKAGRKVDFDGQRR